MSKRTRVGIIGANPERGWAAQAHIPALKSLSDDFEITALSTSRRESADVASKRFGVPLAFDHHQELVNNDAVKEEDGKWIDKGPRVRAGFVAKTRIPALLIALSGVMKLSGNLDQEGLQALGIVAPCREATRYRSSTNVVP
jgi:hypothetical protein